MTPTIKSIRSQRSHLIKILILDIETSFITAGVWGLWNNNVGLNQILDAGQMLCWAAKWFNKREMFFESVYDEHYLDRLWILLDEADAVMTYNGRRFDLPMINREFIKVGLGPPSPFKHIDLLETMKHAFRFPSNKMDHVANELGVGTKVKHEGFPLWIKCCEGDPEAWARMKKYNIGDVKLLEKLYKKVLPWVKSHPNQNLYGTRGVCPTCGGHHLQSRGIYKTQTQEYKRLYCVDCGAWSRTRFTQVPKEERHDILVAAV